MSVDVESRLYRSKSWIDRAASEPYKDDPDGRFIFYWIALSALYVQAEALDDVQPPDWKVQREFIRAVCALDDGTVARGVETLQGDELRRLLENQFLYREYWRDGFTDELTDKIALNLRTRRQSSYLVEVFERVRMLRHQLFHGCAKDGSGANRESIEAGVAVLEALVPAMYDVVSRRGRDKDWGPISFPAKGRPGHPEDKRTR